MGAGDAYQENQKFMNYKIKTLKTEGGPQIFKMKFQMNFILVKDQSGLGTKKQPYFCPFDLNDV